MKLQLSDLISQEPITKVVIHSLEQMSYQVSIVNGFGDNILYDHQAPFSSHSLTEIREMLEPLDVGQYVLRHDCVYEEMIGQPDRRDNHNLDIPLCWQQKEY
ncbi:MAG: DUF6482 family protein [Motiliproteus sp.]|nr:DUF6482 family protein [Motiliproteus sp.]MCW9053776.1 DUF6482 family protein [Motiliproteus sp.]